MKSGTARASVVPAMTAFMRRVAGRGARSFINWWGTRTWTIQMWVSDLWTKARHLTGVHEYVPLYTLDDEGLMMCASVCWVCSEER